MYHPSYRKCPAHFLPPQFVWAVERRGQDEGAEDGAGGRQADDAGQGFAGEEIGRKCHRGIGHGAESD